MKRVISRERDNWQSLVEQEIGFDFHTMYGQPYWDESAYYEFTLKQIENDIEDPSKEMHEMCLHVMEEALESEETLTRIGIPETAFDAIKASWKNRIPSLYGRLDLVYNGTGPAKLLEYNADTPTSLFESSIVQWHWLQTKINAGELTHADQFNSIHEKLVHEFTRQYQPGSHVHFSSAPDLPEDRGTVLYMEDCAHEAGLNNHFVAIEEIGVDARGRILDADTNIIENIFMLYPLEDMFRDDFSEYLLQNFRIFKEPLWKSVISNKGILPLLWKAFPDHPNLLPAYFADDKDKSDLSTRYVSKPLFSREGANIQIVDNDQVIEESAGGYGHFATILQDFAELPLFEDNRTLIGSWIIGDRPAGIGIREDSSLITKDMSRFLPHIII